MTIPLRWLLVLLVVLACTACGGSPFIPQVGPFSGTLQTTTGPLGQFTFTVTDRQLGGTGMLTVDGNLIPVSIIGPLADHDVTGTMTNANLGGGDFIGRFSSGTTASGTFTFVDTAQLVHLSGTWIATAPQ